jgi:multiple sugar transport system substrate-binding protein
MARAASGWTRRAVLASGLAASTAHATTSTHLRAAPRLTLTVAAFPLLHEIARAAIPLWQQQHPDVAIHIVMRQYADHHTAMTTALSTSTLLPDVMALESSYVGRFAHGSGLEDLALEPYGIAGHRAQLVPYAYNQALTRRGAVVAMPTDIGPGTLLYRQDILDRAGVAEAELTQSWDAYIEAASRIKARTGAYVIADAQQVKDIIIRTGFKPGEGLYFDQDSRVLVDSPRFVRAFEVARELRRRKLDARVAAWSNEWAEGFRRGTLATELSGAWLVGQLSNWVAPQTAGLWRAAPLPEGAFVAYGGSFYAIPRRAEPERKALAWDFIRLLTLSRERQLLALKQYDAFPALQDCHDDPFFEQPVPFLAGQPARLLWRDAARRIGATPVHKQNGFADEVIGTELSNVMERGKSIASALADAKRLLERRAHR